MIPSSKSFRHASTHDLALMLRDAHDYTLSLFECFAWGKPGHAGTCSRTGPVWGLGHLAWFAEWLVLREAQQNQVLAGLRPSILSQGDAWFELGRTRLAGGAPALPKAAQLITYKNEVLDRILDRLSRTLNTDLNLYPYRLALAYEDRYAERWIAQLQALGLAAPLELERHVTPPWAQGEIRMPGGNLQMGSAPAAGFVFEQEKSAHPVYVPAFCIDSNLISNAQFAEFVEDSGYQRSQYWSPAGKLWLMQQERSAPLHWSRDGNWWRCQRFGREVTLSPREPVRHVCLYEAQAYCMWAERRLPREAEWEFAAACGHAAFRWGDLWEWTASPFEPYPGFVADPISCGTDSASAFASHQSVRGASFATRARMRSVQYRDFFLPELCESLTGFRTCRA